MLRGFFETVVGAFSPTACAGCGALGPVCRACVARLDALPGLARLGRGAWVRLGPGGLRLRGDEPGLAVCLGPYEGLLRRILAAGKRGRHPGAAPALASRMVRLVRAELPGFFLGLDGILAPPPSADRVWSHPAPVLAAALAEASGVRLLPRLLLRREQAGKARWLGREARPAHVGATFLAGPVRLPWGSRVLLVDDLTTTGATLAHLRRLLALRGVEVARTLTYAETPRLSAGPPRLRRDPGKTGPSAGVIGAPGPPGKDSLAGATTQDPDPLQPFG